MAEFAYNNAKNASFDYTLFELNCNFYPWLSYKKNVNLCSKFKLANKLSAKLRELIIVFQENLYHAQKFRKQAYNKGVKIKNYASSNKVWLNSKYIKTKQNRKLKAKFFKPFQVFHLISKQAYKLELSKK